MKIKDKGAGNGPSLQKRQVLQKLVLYAQIAGNFLPSIAILQRDQSARWPYGDCMIRSNCQTN